MRSLSLALLFLFGLVGEVRGDFSIPNYQPSDFYRYDDNGLVQGLVLTSKFAIFFDEKYPAEENVDYLPLFNERIATVTDIQFNDQLECVIVEFDLKNVFISPQREIVDKLNTANYLAESIGVVKPVFIIDGQEVVPTNKILLKVATAIDQKRLRTYLDSSPKTLGEFEVGALTPHPASPWHYELEIDNLHWPPNMFVLANLLDEQDWVKRAQVVFRGLSFPLAVSFQIMPNGYPTLGEKRFLTMTVVSDPDYAVDEDLLPRLGYGEFYVVESLPETFFKSEPVETETTLTEFKRTTVVTWPFWIYAPGDFHFSAFNLSYAQSDVEEKSTVLVSPGWIGVNSIIKNTNINDIQFLKEYRYKAPAVVAVAGSQSKLVLYVGVACLLVALVVILVCVVVWVWRTAADRRLRRENGENGRQKITELEKVAIGLKGVISYQSVEHYLRRAMAYVWGLPRNVDASELVHHPELSDDEELRVILASSLNELEKRHIRDYEPTDGAVRDLSQNLKVVVEEMKGEQNGA